MAQYPAPPPLRLPDGTLVPIGDAGTQQSFAPTQGAMPYRQPTIDPALDFAPSVPSAAAVAGVMRPPRFFNAAQSAQLNGGPGAGASGFMGKLSGLLGKGGSGLAGAAGGVGAAIKKNPLGALNAGLGLAGALEYATAKAPPMLGKPDTYAPTIRPAQGINSSSLEAGRRGIQSAQTQAGRATGADTGTTAVTRLLAQQQAGEQQGILSLKDNEAFQTDQRRVDEQTNQAYDANYKTQRSFEEKRYDLQQRQFEARRQQGAGMSQAALTYFTQDRADRLNSVERARESALYAQYGVARPEMRTKQAARNTTSTTATEPVSTNAQGGQLPAAFARGGSLRIKTKTSFGGAHARASKAFAERMDTITAQAMDAFQTTLREASNKRSRGISGK